MATPFPLGRVQEHDPRSLAFPAPTTTNVVSKSWRHYGLVLDQGSLGSCTGNAAAQSLNTAPYHVIGTPTYREPDAVDFYSRATVLDGFTGTYPPDDTGSSGLAVSKVLQERGLISAYTHAFGLDHLLAALMSGPCIVGTDWMNDMFNPDSAGVVHPTGGVVGGHEYLCNGVNVSSKMLRFVNSWSSSWGIRGHFYMSFDDFSVLLNDGGDAILFTV